MGLLVLALGGAGWAGRAAWRATQLREEYISGLLAASKAEPHNAHLLALLGGRLVQAGHFDKASWVLQDALQNGSVDPLCWRTAAASAAAIGHLDQARQTLQRGQRQGVPGLSEASDRLSQLGSSAGPAPSAAAILPEGNKALAAECASGSFLNGVVAWWGRRHPEASGFATREAWAGAAPDDADAQRLWGEALLRNRAVAQAAGVLDRAVSLDPGSAGSHRARGEAAMLAGDLDRAATEFQASLKLRPDWGLALVGLADVQLRQGNVPSATSLYEEATRAEPASAEAWLGLGRAYLQWSWRVQDAVAAFARAAALTPARTDFFTDYAQALSTRYRFDDAEAVLRRRLLDDPTDGRAHYQLGCLLARNRPDAKRQADAERELRSALQYAPDQPATLLELAQLRLRDGQVIDTIALLRSVLARDPLNLPAARTLAGAYRLAEQPDAAQAADARADKLARAVAALQVATHRATGDPQNPHWPAELAGIYQALGLPDKARAAAAQAARLRAAHRAPARIAPAGSVSDR